MDLSRLKYPLLVAGTGLLVGLLIDLMTYDQPLGISVPIGFALLVIAMLALAIREDVPIRVANLWLIVPLLFLAIMMAVRAEPLLRFLNFMGAFALLLLLANRLTDEPIFKLDLWEYTVALLEASIVSPFLSFPLIARVIKATNLSNASEHRTTTRRIAVGLLIAVPFLLVFTALFASADLVFNNLILSLFSGFRFGDIFGHAIMTAVYSILFMGGLTYALIRPLNLFKVTAGAAPLSELSPAERDTANFTAPSASVNVPNLKGWLGSLEAFIVLFMVDALFLVFVVIQFAAMFGGEAFLRSQNLTYSEYARRGFFELLAVALITLSLILALDFVTRRENSQQRLIFLIGSGLMTLMTIIILASAYKRLQLYEEAYGFTQLRVQVHVFMIWLALLMAVFFVMLVIHRPRWFATATLIVMIGIVGTLDVLNQDAFIVRQNLERARHGEELDVAFLGSLSEDAVPLLVPVFKSGTEEQKQTLGYMLRLKQLELDSRQSHAGWASYHVAINRAYRELNTIRKDLEQYQLR